jgi:hypothetical protein
MEVVAKYKLTYRDLYEDHDVEEKDQRYHHYVDPKDELKDYNVFKEANAELFNNTDYYIVETSYTRRLFGYEQFQKEYENCDSIIALESRYDDGFYDGPEDIEFYYAANNEGQYLLDNLPKNIRFNDNTKRHLSGWFGFKARKNLDIIDCIDILRNIHFCGFLCPWLGMQIIWFKLPNGKIAAFCHLDTESG